MKKTMILFFCAVSLGMIGCSTPTDEVENLPVAARQLQDTVVPEKMVAVPKEPATTESKKIEGTYLKGNAKNGGGYLAVQEKEGNTLKFQLNLYRGMPSNNSGYLEGEMTYENNVAIYSSTEYGECTITFEFSKEKVRISQEGRDMDCGFGAGVYADIDLKRTNTKAVFLDDYGAPIE